MEGIGLLSTWPESRRPSAANSRHIIGSWAAKSALQYFAVEYLVHLTWRHYDYLQTVISHLGARKCDIDVGCGGSFVIMDLSFMALGVGAVTAAWLISSTVLQVGAPPGFVPKDRALVKRRRRPHAQQNAKTPRRLPAAIRIAMGATGIGLVGVGICPDDYLPIGHYVSTTIVVAGSVATLAMLGILWLRPRPKTAWVMLFFAAVSTVGAVGFGLPVVAGIFPGVAINLGWTGLFERMVVYAFIFGLFGMGLALTNGSHLPSVVAGEGEAEGQGPTRGSSLTSEALAKLPDPVHAQYVQTAGARTHVFSNTISHASSWIQTHRPRRRP